MPLRSLEVLSLLVERAGEVVSKDEIWRGVWNDAFVEETNLTHNIYLLRKTFKEFGLDGVIQTVPRRGYRFAGEVRLMETAELTLEKRTITKAEIEFDAGPPFERESIGWVSDRSTNATLRGVRPRHFIFTGVFSLVLFAAAAYFWTGSRSGQAGTTGVRSIAILPLQPLNKGDVDDGLGLGLADNLTSRLGRIGSLKVRSTNSLSDLQLTGRDPAELGRLLNADSLLTGSFQRSDGRIRVLVRLLNTSDGSQAWSGNFDEAETNIFALQDALAEEIARSLTSMLSPHDQQLLSKRYTLNRDAYEAYLRGRFFFDKRDSDNYLKAIAEFERAISLDPNYALAYSGLADVYAMQVQFDGPRHLLLGKQRAYSLKALELDEQLAEAHTSLAWVYRGDWNWEGSEQHFKRAIELNPNYVNARQWYALLLTTLGRFDEALIQIEKATEIDPLSRAVMQNQLAVMTYRNQSDRMAELIQKIASFQEDEAAKLRDLAIAYHRIGDDRKTIATADELMRLNHGETKSKSLDARLAVAYERVKKHERSKQILDSLEKQLPSDTYVAYHLAMAYADLGNREKALRLLETCFNAKDDRLLWIKVEPRFEPLRGDPRFQELLRKMDLL